jgi:hypothetical protein
MPPNEPSVSPKAQLPAWLAIEFLADAKSEEAEKEKKKEIGEEAAVVSFRDLLQALDDEDANQIRFVCAGSCSARWSNTIISGGFIGSSARKNLCCLLPPLLYP